MAERTPLCSIGLPVYNGANYLKEAIRSVLEQGFEDFELIISDNASTDETADICRSFAECDSRIVYVRQPKNIGAAKNYNHVFYLSRGTYFNWLAHDDILASSFLSTSVAGHAESGRSTVLVYPRFRYIDGAGATIPLRDEPVCVESEASTPAKRMFETLERLGIVTSIFGMFRRDALARTRLIGSYIASDYVLLVECALLGRIRRLATPEPLFFRRLHDGGSQRANCTPAEVAAWFDPETVADNSPSRRITREYVTSIMLTPGLSSADRAASAAYLLAQRVLLKRRVIEVQWRKRREFLA